MRRHHTGCTFKDLNMKVVAAVILVIGSASALGSGPYLPSGWRPDGPAFELPTRPVVVPPLDIILHGSEASGSDFLREYGPPKIQILPEVATEQSFVVISAKFSEEEKSAADAEVIEAATEAFTDLKYEAVEDSSSATESAVVETATEVVKEELVQENPEQLAVEGRFSNVEAVAEVETTQKYEETTLAAKEDNVQVKSSEDVGSELVGEIKTVEEVKVVEQEVKTVEGEVETVKEEVKTVEQEVKTVVEEARIVGEGVKNIAEAIVGLEGIVAQEVQTQDLSQVKSVEVSSGLVQVPEGFLEYGPPGFREYGTPIQNIAPRTAEEVQSEDEKIENNETRRRRFSPKFRTTKAKKH